MKPDRRRAVLVASQPSRAAFQPIVHPPSFAQEDLDEAFARGFLAGTENAEAETRRAATQIAAGIEAAREAMIQELRRIDAARRDDIVEFAFEIARWLVQSEVATDPARLLPRLEAALPDRLDDIVVKVAPSLVATIQAALPAVQVVGDGALAPADIRLTGPDAQIDGTIDDALTRLRVFLSADDGTLQ